MTGPKYEEDPFGASPQGVQGYDENPFGAAPAATGGYSDNPFSEQPSTSPVDVQQEAALALHPPTSRDIASEQSGNKAANKQALQALLDSPKTTPAQKARLAKLVEAMDDPMLYNKVTQSRFFGSNFLRGLATGAISEGVLGTTDFLASVAEVGAKGADLVFDSKLAESVQAGRGGIAEAQQDVKDTFDPEGISGSAGRITGALASQMIGGGSKAVVTGAKSAFGGGAYGAVASALTKRLAGSKNFIGAAARLAERGNFVQRMMVNVLSGAPIDVIQAYTLPESDVVKVAHAKQEQGIELTVEDENALDDHAARQLETLALGLTASGVGGALVEGMTRSLGGAAQKIKAGAGTAAVPGASTQELTTTADAMIALGEIAKKRSLSRKAASGAWSQGNVEMRKKLLAGLTDDHYATEFKKLPGDVQQSLMEAFGGPKIGPIADSQLNTSPPAAAAPAAATPTVSPSSTPTAGPPPAAAPVPASTPPAAAGTVEVIKEVKRLGLMADLKDEVKQRGEPTAINIEHAARTVLDNHYSKGHKEAPLLVTTKVIDATGTNEDQNWHKIPIAEWNRIVAEAEKRGLDIKRSSNYDLSGDDISWETVLDREDGFGNNEQLLGILRDLGYSEITQRGFKSPAARSDVPTVETIKRAKQRVGQQAISIKAKEIAKNAGRDAPTNGDIEAAARTFLEDGEIFTRKLAAGAVAGAEVGGAGKAGGELDGPLVGDRAVSPVDKVISEVETALHQKTADLERRLADVERKAAIDDMTGFQNKNAWGAARARIDADESLELVSFDLGNLKATNDKVGIDAGDEVIRRAANAIRASVGEGDNPQFFRPGGDELLVAIPKGRGFAVGDAAVKAFGVSPIGDAGVNNFLRYGVGQTFEAADVAVRAAKSAQVEVRYDRSTKSKVEAVASPASPPATGVEAQIEELKRKQLIASPIEATRIQRQIRELRKTIPEHAPTNVPETGPATKADDGPRPVIKAPPKVDPSAANDAGHTATEIAEGRVDPRAKDGYAFISGEMRPVTGDVLNEMKAFRDEQVKGIKEKLAALKLEKEPDTPNSTLADKYFGSDSRVPGTKKDIAARLNQQIKEANQEIMRFTRQHERLIASNKVPELGIGNMPDTYGKDLSKFDPDQLLNVKRSLRSMINQAEKGGQREKALQTEFARVMDYEAKRDGGHSVTLQMHPTVAGGVGGFFVGYVFPADSDEERLRHAAWFGAVGLAGGVFANRRWGPGVPRARPKLTPWEAQVADKVKSHDDLKKPPVPFMMRLRQFYTATVSRSAPVRAATKALGGEDLPTQRNAGKLMQIFGRWQAQTESFLIDGPSLVDKDGNIKWLDALPVQKIFELVQGDSDRLGLLMASARALELGARGINTGIDAMAARMTFIKAAPEYHQAMTEMRKFNGALVDVADEAGLVADRDKMSDIFYAPLNRIFGGEIGSPALVQTVTSKIKSALGGSNPIKALKGGQQVILNPAEATVGNTARILRGAEMNKMATTLADLVDAAPDKALAGRIGKFLHGSERVQLPGYSLKIAKLQQEMAALGSTVSQEEAEKLIQTMSNEALNVQDDVLRFWRKGKIEQIRLNPEVAKAFRSLNPAELDGLFKFIGIPTQTARLGIVNNPLFVARQAWRDNWQAWLNSEYGFIPFVTQAQGWFAAVTRNKDYKEYLAAGGGYGSFAEQRFAKGQTALPDVQRAPVKNALTQAATEVKELRVLSAYQTLITPVVEAARVGEYLRARGHGASAIEAVYAAKHVTANYQDIGTNMRAAGHLTLFLNPAIKSLEQSAKSFKRDPIAYLTKSFVGIALPSYYFWHTYQKDEELNQLRSTETGRKYWWTRTPGGSIAKIPKPIFDGQLFGSTVETVMDRAKLKDPESMQLTARSVYNDVSLNLLPQLGVIPYSLITNTDLGSGQAIVPQRVEGIDAQYQSGPTTSQLARVVGKATNVAPSQIDFTIRSVFGQLGINAVRIISSAVTYQETGYVPPKEEMPFMEELFGRYPSQNVGAIREFYRNAERVDEVAKTIGHAAKYDAENLAGYIEANEGDAGLIDLYKDTRTKIAELRASAEDIRLMPPGTISQEDRKLIIDEMFRAMIETAKASNLAARSVREIGTPGTGPTPTARPADRTPVRQISSRNGSAPSGERLPPVVETMMRRAKAQHQSMPDIVESDEWVGLSLAEKRTLLQAIESDTSIPWDR